MQFYNLVTTVQRRTFTLLVFTSNSGMNASMYSVLIIYLTLASKRARYKPRPSESMAAGQLGLWHTGSNVDILAIWIAQQVLARIQTAQG